MRNIALIGLAVLVLGLGTINIQHHMNLPDIDKYEIISHLQLPDFYNRTTDIRLNDEIKGENTVKNVVTVLNRATEGDVVNFHLAGYGGEVETVFYIINNIKQSKATVNMIVEAPVYSGHAYLALSGSTLTMLPLTYLMIHTTSAINYDCNKQTGTDRGVSNVEHCQVQMLNHLKLMNELLVGLPVLTPEEKMSVATGHDVYITSNEFYKRINSTKQ